MAKTEFDKLNSRLKYYLLDYKDTHFDEVKKSFNTTRLRDLSRFQLKLLFKKAVDNDKNF